METEERLALAIADLAVAVSDDLRDEVWEAERSTRGRTAQYARARRRLERAANAAANAVRSGSLTPDAAAARFAAAYERAALDAAVSAASRARVAPSSAVFAAVEDEVDRTARRFGGFLAEIGDLTDGEVDRRLSLYVDRLDGFRNKVWADAVSGEGVTWWWELGGGDHCEDCLLLHLESPYDERPPTVPCMGGTVCGANCKCTLTMTTEGRVPGT